MKDQNVPNRKFFSKKSLSIGLLGRPHSSEELTNFMSPLQNIRACTTMGVLLMCLHLDRFCDGGNVLMSMSYVVYRLRHFTPHPSILKFSLMTWSIFCCCSIYSTQILTEQKQLYRQLEWNQIIPIWIQQSSFFLRDGRCLRLLLLGPTLPICTVIAAKSCSLGSDFRKTRLARWLQ